MAERSAKINFKNPSSKKLWRADNDPNDFDFEENDNPNLINPNYDLSENEAMTKTTSFQYLEKFEFKSDKSDNKENTESSHVEQRKSKFLTFEELMAKELNKQDEEEEEKTVDMKSKVPQVNRHQPQLTNVATKPTNNLTKISKSLTNGQNWESGFEWDSLLDKINKNIFGNSSFRPKQREIINAMKSKYDVIALIPTGGGKSLTFQLASQTESGVTIVIMPLLSLINDQVTQMKELRIK